MDARKRFDFGCLIRLAGDGDSMDGVAQRRHLLLVMETSLLAEEAGLEASLSAVRDQLKTVQELLARWAYAPEATP